MLFFFFFQAEDGIRDLTVTGVQTCALPILSIASFTYGALLGGFFLGMLWRGAIQRDAITGIVVVIGAIRFVVFAKPWLLGFPLPTGLLTMLAHLSFPWYVLNWTSFTG